MRIHVNVQLEEGEQPIDQEAAAQTIFEVLNGDVSKDEIILYVQSIPSEPVRIGPELAASSSE